MSTIYLTKEFARQGRRSGVSDEGLREAVARADGGKIDADLGGGIIKQRVAREHEGRSSGFRTILAYRRGGRAIFLHVFPKSKKANISKVELETFQALAQEFERLTDEQLERLVRERGWRKLE